jgi:hypothetical protein
MRATITTQSITFFKTEAVAAALAATNGAADVDSSYTVEAWARGFVVVIRDEDGFKLGTL